MTFFKTPKSINTSFQERAKFNFVWRITLVFTLVIFIITTIGFFTNDKFFFYYLVVLLMTTTSLYFIARFRTYKSVARILYFSISIIVSLSIFSINDALNVQQALWMVVLILTAFFTLGHKWGMFYMILNTTIYAVYYNFFFQNSVDLRLNLTADVLFFMSIEFMISMFLIGFVMFQYELINKYALKNAEEAYEELKNEKQIVEHQNKEKTILLQEIHHRVKNNLQVIVSLLRLQSRDLKSEEAKSSFEDAITRILTMALIHQKLYEKESLMNIDIKDYLNTLIKNLIETSSVSGSVQFEVNSSLKSVSMKSIVPLGLIISELVSNSLKHAFDTSGRIELSLSPGEGGEFKMTYSDDGQWKENNKETFGTQLIEVFTDQLEGSFKREYNDSGTYYYFTLLEN